MRTMLMFISCLLLCGSAVAGLWDTDLCEFTCSAGSPVVLLAAPDGSGPSLDAAVAYGTGEPVDATLRVILRDAMAMPIAAFPAEDVWVETLSGGVSFCPAGSIADAPSDVDGVMFITHPFLAGGSSDPVGGDGLVCFVNGMAIPASPVPFYIVTPDLHPDMVVNMSDVILFIEGLLGGVYDFGLDLHHDGVINLSDIIELGQMLNTNCP